MPLSPQTGSADPYETAPGSHGARVLFVGRNEPERRRIAQFFVQLRPDSVVADPDRSQPTVSFATAESILDALFVSGNAAAEGSRGVEGGRRGENPFTCILVACQAEIDHLETGIRSLRRVNPDARIILFCEPADEANCRAALQWDADDYFLLPLDDRDLRKVAAMGDRSSSSQSINSRTSSDFGSSFASAKRSDRAPRRTHGRRWSHRQGSRGPRRLRPPRHRNPRPPFPSLRRSAIHPRRPDS